MRIVGRSSILRRTFGLALVLTATQASGNSTVMLCKSTFYSSAPRTFQLDYDANTATSLATNQARPMTVTDKEITWETADSQYTLNRYTGELLEIWSGRTVRWMCSPQDKKF
jgi:hypothetical protein